MTLRARLLSLTLAMVTIMAFTMVALSLNSVAVSSIEVALGSSEMAGHQVQSLMERRLEEVARQRKPTSLLDVKRLWRQVAADDPEIAILLEQTMAQSRSIVEIDVAGDDVAGVDVSGNNGVVLASSNPRSRGKVMHPRPDLRALLDANIFRRIVAILSAAGDYETRVPIGIAGQRTPLFTIQILLSPVLLRDATYRQLRSVLVASGLALALAFLLAWWAAHVALRPLAHIGHLIDDISAGRAPEAIAGKRKEADELTAIESGLSLLGQRYRGAQEDASQLRANLEGVLEKLDAETRRQVETQLSLARRLTAINSLTGGVAHEIKNPLNSIALRLEMLRGRVTDDAPDTEPEFAILSEEVTRLDRVVRTFLDFNRPVELQFADLDLGAEAADILQLMDPEAVRKGIRSSYQIPEIPVIVKGDAGLLRQALLNLVVNAIEAMSDGGELNVSIVAQSQTCSIRISDTGPGIPLDQIDRIFQLYYTTRPQGSGIGLAMTSRAVQLHGGSIAVESEPGQGTTFEVTLPLANGPLANGHWRREHHPLET